MPSPAWCTVIAAIVAAAQHAAAVPLGAAAASDIAPPPPPPPAASFPADCDVAVHLGSDCSGDHTLVATKCQTIAGL